jgi:hypothetical protein
MDESKTPPTHLGSCRYLTLYRGLFGFVYHSIALLYHEVPNPYLTIRNFFIAVGGARTSNAACGLLLAADLPPRSRGARSELATVEDQGPSEALDSTSRPAASLEDPARRRIARPTNSLHQLMEKRNLPPSLQGLGWQRPLVQRPCILTLPRPLPP